MPSAADNPELYESIVLAGVRSPGQVTLSGHDRKIGWDVKKGPAQTGATTSRTSEDPVEFVASFYLVKDDSLDIDDFADWETFLELAKSTIAGATPKALDVYHPDLARNDIKSVVLSQIAGVVHDDVGGETHALSFLEYRPAKKKGGTPSGSKSKASPSGIDPNDPDAAALAEIDRLTKQYEQTPWS